MGVTFGTKHSLTDYAVNYIHKSIGSPTPKKVEADIPLADGKLDLTENLVGSAPRFENRVITFGFEMRSTRGQWLNDWATIAGDLHGKMLDVILDEDPNYYWHGRVSVGALEDHGASAGLTITVDAEPYKKKNSLTTWATWTTTGSKTVTLTAPVAWPVFVISSGSLTITAQGESWTITPSQQTCPGLVFRKGSNTLTVSGTVSSLVCKYREGAL